MKPFSKFFTPLALASFLLLTGCGSSTAPSDSQEGTPASSITVELSDLDRILERGHLIVGTFGDRPPYGLVESDLSLSGLDPFIARRFAYELFGDEDAIEFVVTEAASRLEFLRSNRVDLIMATFTVTPEREEQVHFALPYMTVQLGLVLPEDSDISSVADLDGRDLIVNAGTTAEIYFTQNHPNVNLLSFNQNTEAFNALLDGRGDAMSHDDTLLYPWAFNNPGYRVISGIGTMGYIAPAVNQNSTELLAFLNETILRLREEGFFELAFDETLRDNFVAGTVATDIMVTQ